MLRGVIESLIMFLLFFDFFFVCVRKGRTNYDKVYLFYSLITVV